MADLAELLKPIAESSASAEEVATALQTHAHPIWQEVFNAGHSKATEQLKGRVETLEAKVKDADKAAAAAEARLDDLRKQQPDTATLREQYEAQIEELKADHKAKVAKIEAERAAAEESRTARDVQNALIAQGVDPVYAEVLMDKADNRGRIRFVDGETQLLQAGKEIPISAGDGQTAVQVMAAEIEKTVPAKFKSSKVDTGSGTRPSDSSGGKGTVFNRIREEVAEKQKASAGRSAEASDELAKRMNLTG